MDFDNKKDYSFMRIVVETGMSVAQLSCYMCQCWFNQKKTNSFQGSVLTFPLPTAFAVTILNDHVGLLPRPAGTAKAEGERGRRGHSVRDSREGVQGWPESAGKNSCES